MKVSLTYIFLCFCFCANSQYDFKEINKIECSDIKNQARTGTCWSFATSSFIESELLRKGKGEIDLSEMYVVRNIYNDKARNYVLRQGKANFSQGSLSHDLMRIIDKNGIVPESAYNGLLKGQKKYDHSEMEAGLKGFLDGITKEKKLSKTWKIAFESILDAYMGDYDNTFKYNGKEYTPNSFADYLDIDSEDYVSYSSFTHHPFGKAFILEIPDNYSNGSFMNIPIDELIALIDKAVEQGYTVAWDGDVSEKSFDAKKGIAVLAADPKREDLFENPGKELEVTQEARQESFENYTTTDDHLMHIVGKAKDKKGTEYYIVKNSWGEISPYKGYLYMSKAYAAMKTVAIMVHQDVKLN